MLEYSPCCRVPHLYDARQLSESDRDTTWAHTANQPPAPPRRFRSVGVTVGSGRVDCAAHTGVPSAGLLSIPTTVLGGEGGEVRADFGGGSGFSAGQAWTGKARVSVCRNMPQHAGAVSDTAGGISGGDCAAGGSRQAETVDSRFEWGRDRQRADLQDGLPEAAVSDGELDRDLPGDNALLVGCERFS